MISFELYIQNLVKCLTNIHLCWIELKFFFIGEIQSLDFDTDLDYLIKLTNLEYNFYIKNLGNFKPCLV